MARSKSQPRTRGGKAAKKVARLSLLPWIWQAISSPQLSFLLVILILMISVLATISIHLKSIATPDFLYFMNVWGFSDPFHSGWFISIQAALGLNLFLFVIDRFPKAWRSARLVIPPAIDSKTLIQNKKNESPFLVTLESNVGREDFREMIKGWIGKKSAGQVIRDEGGLNELQIGYQTGRYFPVSIYLVYVGILVLMIGGALNFFGGFEGRMAVDEGSRTDYLEVTREETAQRDWSHFNLYGQVMPGFYKPGFEIQCSKMEFDFDPETQEPRNVRSVLDFYVHNKLMATRVVSTFEPVRFNGMTFFQGEAVNTGQQNVNLTVIDSKRDKHLNLTALNKGNTYGYPDFSLQILDINLNEGANDADTMGPSVQLEYKEGVLPPEHFWLFQKFPKFDSAHRKKSRFHFSIESLKPRFTTHLVVTKNPGNPYLLAGALLALISLILYSVGPNNRIWIIWQPGKVVLYGWSNRFYLFRSRFSEASRQFQGRLMRIDKEIKE